MPICLYAYMPIIVYYVLVLLLLTYMSFCLKCVGHELCCYYVNDVIVRVFNSNCLLTLTMLCVYIVFYAYFEIHLLYYNV